MLTTIEQPHFLRGTALRTPGGILSEEELYVVELPPHGPYDCDSEWTVKVIEHCGFPRRDVPAEATFEQAT